LVRLAAQLNQECALEHLNGKPIDFLGTLALWLHPSPIFEYLAMDTRGTKKSWLGAYRNAGVDGYCLLRVPGQFGGIAWELALRPGWQHSASESEYKLERACRWHQPCAYTFGWLARQMELFALLKLMQEISVHSQKRWRARLPSSSSGTRPAHRWEDNCCRKKALTRDQVGDASQLVSVSASGRASRFGHMSASQATSGTPGLRLTEKDH